MSNEDLPQSAELASAYLDGELDGPERAAAAADPDIMAAVDSLARVRAALGEVGPVDPFAKSSAIAAALAEFDAMRTDAGTSTEPPKVAGLAPVVALQPRRSRLFGVVTGAAAAAIVGVIAIAALNSNGGNDDSASSASAVPAFDAAASTPELKSPAGGAIEAATAATDAPGSAAASADIAATTVPIIDSTDALTEFAASREIAATTAAPAGTAAPTATEAAAAPSAQQPPSQLGNVAVTCLSSAQLIIGPIVYQGTPAVAVRNTATGGLQAIADTSCRVLAEVPAP